MKFKDSMEFKLWHSHCWLLLAIFAVGFRSKMQETNLKMCCLDTQGTIAVLQTEFIVVKGISGITEVRLFALKNSKKELGSSGEHF